MIDTDKIKMDVAAAGTLLREIQIQIGEAEKKVGEGIIKYNEIVNNFRLMQSCLRELDQHLEERNDE